MQKKKNCYLIAMLILLAFPTIKISAQNYLKYDYDQVNIYFENNTMSWMQLDKRDMPLARILTSYGQAGYELISIVDLPGSFPNWHGRSVSGIRTLIFKRSSSPSEAYVQTLLNRVDTTMKGIAARDIALAKMQIMDNINKVTQSTLTEDFRKELKVYIDEHLEMIQQKLEEEIKKTIKTQ